MKILFLGDGWRSGRSAVIKIFTIIKIKDRFSIVNAENATSGMGLSVKHAEILEMEQIAYAR